jgi:hypothetical protein
LRGLRPTAAVAGEIAGFVILGLALQNIRRCNEREKPMSKLMMLLEETFSATVATVSAALPGILVAAIVVVVGVLLARTAKALVHQALRITRFETFAERSGMSNVLGRADVEQSASEIIGTIVYWMILVFTGLVALTALGFAEASTFAVVGSMIPSVVVAAAILILGLNVSAFIAKLIQTAAVNAEVRQARFVRNAAHYAMATLVAIVALKQLGVPGDILGMAFYMFFGGTCLALALAFGLGSRELAGQIIGATFRAEQDKARALSEASELGNQIFPTSKLRKQTRMRSKVAA